MKIIVLDNGVSPSDISSLINAIMIAGPHLPYKLEVVIRHSDDVYIRESAEPVAPTTTTSPPAVSALSKARQDLIDGTNAFAKKIEAVEIGFVEISQPTETLQPDVLIGQEDKLLGPDGSLEFDVTAETFFEQPVDPEDLIEKNHDKKRQAADATKQRARQAYSEFGDLFKVFSSEQPEFDLPKFAGGISASLGDPQQLFDDLKAGASELYKDVRSAIDFLFGHPDDK